MHVVIPDVGPAESELLVTAGDPGNEGKLPINVIVGIFKLLFNY